MITANNEQLFLNMCSMYNMLLSCTTNTLFEVDSIGIISISYGNEKMKIVPTFACDGAYNQILSLIFIYNDQATSQANQTLLSPLSTTPLRAVDVYTINNISRIFTDKTMIKLK